MRAARLLQILLLLQNRGRMTSAQLADELEVARRTILRDVDAMTEAGLPVIVFQGNQGGIELGFNYRTRLTGLSEDEAKALGLILDADNPLVSALGLEAAARQARRKLVESLPDGPRTHASQITDRFVLKADRLDPDPRISALAKAVAAGVEVRLNFAGPKEQKLRPDQLSFGPDGWQLRDGETGEWWRQLDWGRVNIATRPPAS